ncbi:DUF4190 domain-containing protein [Wenzhouxiangella sp. XN79A]|uniref:DUF4190 domain-containing protein n=1 Tax=Wenzhouxiangella sp. XN79A TaxID=2724193 RepID=UPI00144AAE3F|nr:DUF4190 domain-containing protein [Wenzhouxiangella sp. XN79A]NKI33695.1 DUF4190 domain-containing protein [Wenzhouxiangella sp. XN79A]
MAASSETHPLALLSLICGILAWVAFPILGSLVAIVAGHAALNQSKREGFEVGGAGLARAGLILGWLQIGLIVLVAAFWIALALLAGALTGLGVIVLVVLGVALAAALLGLMAMFFVGGV